ncbi:MAG: hypothetical protein ACI86H_002512, partial [bacterium]
MKVIFKAEYVMSYDNMNLGKDITKQLNDILQISKVTENHSEIGSDIKLYELF